LRRRLALDREQRGRDLHAREPLEQGLGARLVFSGDDERVLSELARERADVGERAGAEDDAAGGGEFKAHARELPIGDWRLPISSRWYVCSNRPSAIGNRQSRSAPQTRFAEACRLTR